MIIMSLNYTFQLLLKLFLFFTCEQIIPYSLYNYLIGLQTILCFSNVNSYLYEIYDYIYSFVVDQYVL